MQTSNPTILEAGVRANFLTGVADATAGSYLARIATTIPSSKRTEEYAWIGESPAMSLWRGTSRYDAMTDAKYSLTNAKYQAGILVDEDDMADDQLGALPLRARQLGEGVPAHIDERIMEALITGTTNAGHDGNAFFDDTHPARGLAAAQDNLLAGTGTTTAQIQTDITSAIVAHMGFVRENGKKFHGSIRQLVVVAPPGVFGTMEEAIKSTLISNTSNVRFNAFTIDTLYAPELSVTGSSTDANDWYLLNVGTALRPLIWQEREAVGLTRIDDEENGQIKFIIKGRHVEGYGHWAGATKTVNS